MHLKVLFDFGEKNVGAGDKFGTVLELQNTILGDWKRGGKPHFLLFRKPLSGFLNLSLALVGGWWEVISSDSIVTASNLTLCPWINQIGRISRETHYSKKVIQNSNKLVRFLIWEKKIQTEFLVPHFCYFRKSHWLSYVRKVYCTYNLIYFAHQWPKIPNMISFW